jgi:hypothetical protein
MSCPPRNDRLVRALEPKLRDWSRRGAVVQLAFSIPALLALVSCMGNAADLGNALDLIGEWRFDQGQGINGTLTFRRNGTYHYTVSQGQAWKVEHDGEYSLAPHGRPRTRVVTLRPTKVLSEAGFDGYRQLGSRMMLDNSANTFYLVDDSRGRQEKTLYNQRCGFCAIYWVIEK